MITRRRFLQQAGALTVGSAALSHQLFARPAARPIGLQLFTLFDTIDNDVDGHLKKVAELGVTELESAFSKKGGFYGMAPKEFAAKAKSFGLSWHAHHVLGAPFKLPPGAKMPVGANGKPIEIPPMKNLKDNMQELVDGAAEGGVGYLVCANTPIGTKDEIKSSIEVINKTAEACAKAGIQLAYHNHDAEFRPVEGEVPYEMFLAQFLPGVKMELDLGWTSKAGIDPVKMFERFPGRFPLWHVKDMDKDFKNIVPVGQGVIDFKRIFAKADVAGLKHAFLEHDMPADAFKSISESVAYIKTIG